MIKYYHFIASKSVNVTSFNDALMNAYSMHYSLIMESTQKGYIISDERFYDVLENLFPLLTQDLDNFFTFLVSHANDELSYYALIKSTTLSPGKVNILSEVILDLALLGDKTLLNYMRKEFLGVDHQIMLTAETFIRCGLNASLAAKKLYVHRNTFNYRLNQFIDATNLDIRDYYNAQYFSLYQKLNTQK
jgi:hypothetical protein